MEDSKAIDPQSHKLINQSINKSTNRFRLQQIPETLIANGQHIKSQKYPQFQQKSQCL